MGGSGDGEMPARENEERLDDEGGESKAAGKVAGPKPDFRIVQPEYVPALGKTVYKDVGAMWHNVSKSGNEFYTMKIGKLKLLVFQNAQK